MKKYTIKNKYAIKIKLKEKEIWKTTRQWKDPSCLWISKINTEKISLLSKVVYRFNTVPLKFPMAFFAEIDKKVLKHLWKHKIPQTPKAMPSRKGDVTMLNVRLRYRAAWHWQRKQARSTVVQ